MFKDEKEKKREMKNTQIRNAKRMAKRQKQKRAQRD